MFHALFGVKILSGTRFAPPLLNVGYGTRCFKPGLNPKNWNSLGVPDFLEECNRGIAAFRSVRDQVTESAHACSYILSKQVRETCQFWLSTFWLLTVPSPST